MNNLFTTRRAVAGRRTSPLSGDGPGYLPWPLGSGRRATRSPEATERPEPATSLAPAGRRRRHGDGRPRAALGVTQQQPDSRCRRAACQADDTNCHKSHTRKWRRHGRSLFILLQYAGRVPLFGTAVVSHPPAAALACACLVYPALSGRLRVERQQRRRVARQVLTGATAAGCRGVRPQRQL